MDEADEVLLGLCQADAFYSGGCVFVHWTEFEDVLAEFFDAGHSILGVDGMFVRADRVKQPELRLISSGRVSRFEELDMLLRRVRLLEKERSLRGKNAQLYLAITTAMD